MKSTLEKLQDLLESLPPRPLWQIELHLRYGGWVSDQDRLRYEASQNIIRLEDRKKLRD